MAPEYSCDAWSPYSTLDRSLGTILNTAAPTKECKHLLSLTTRTIYHRGAFPQISSPSSNSTPHPTTASPPPARTPIPLLSPIFEEALRPPALWIVNVHHQDWFLEDITIAQSFWLFVLQNSGLIRLSLPVLRVSNNIVTDVFVYEFLPGLTRLKELKLNLARLNAPTVLRTLSCLERLHMNDWSNLSSLDQDFAGLRPLLIDAFVDFVGLLKALDRLPGLTFLRPEGLRNDTAVDYEIKSGVVFAVVALPRKRRKPFSVKVFEILGVKVAGWFTVGAVSFTGRL